MSEETRILFMGGFGVLCRVLQGLHIGLVSWFFRVLG